MKLILLRKYLKENYTIGDLIINGEFFCNTIEDTVRNLPLSCPDTIKGQNCKCTEKKYAETAIPAGVYKVTLSYSAKFKRILPYIHDVPHFIGIRIHSGNTEKDSAGCPIVGMNTAKGRVTNSRATEKRLIEILSDATDITIEVR